MKAFVHNNRTYLRVIPSKFMMNSTLIYDIVTRGDVLALDIEDQKLVCIKGTEQVQHYDADINIRVPEAPEKQAYQFDLSL